MELLVALFAVLVVTFTTVFWEFIDAKRWHSRAGGLVVVTSAAMTATFGLTGLLFMLGMIAIGAMVIWMDS